MVPEWWRESLHIPAPGSSTSPPMEPLLSLLANVRTDYHAQGLRTAALAADVRSMAFRRAMERLDNSSPAYAFATLSPRQWWRALRLLGIREPSFMARSALPERECEAALAPANVTQLFERSLRWRMLTVGGLKGSGMHLHVDNPPFSSWHVQLRGRKRFTLCRPTRPLKCSSTTLEPLASLYYPSSYAHSTHTLDDGAISLSRSLITPSHAARTADALGRFFGCFPAGSGSALIAAYPMAYPRLCAALRPCLRRLALWGHGVDAVGRVD